MDTQNKHMVGAAGEDIVILRPPMTRLSRADALLLAAWLVCLAEKEDGQFERVLKAVQGD